MQRMRWHLKVPAAAMVILAGCGGTENRCVGVNATIATSYSTAPGCTSPVGVCTAGNVTSENLKGTTWFSASTTQPGPPPGLDFYTGDLVITTADGTVTLHDYGVLNSTSGLYFEMQEVTSGTGAQAGKTRMPVSQSTATATGLKSTLRRSICAKHSREGSLPPQSRPPPNAWLCSPRAPAPN